MSYVIDNDEDRKKHDKYHNRDKDTSHLRVKPATLKWLRRFIFLFKNNLFSKIYNITLP